MRPDIMKNTFVSFVLHLDARNSLLSSALLVLLLPYFRNCPVGGKQSCITFMGISSRHRGLLSQRSHCLSILFFIFKIFNLFINEREKERESVLAHDPHVTHPPYSYCDCTLKQGETLNLLVLD